MLIVLFLMLIVDDVDNCASDGLFWVTYYIQVGLGELIMQVLGTEPLVAPWYDLQRFIYHIEET